MQINKLSASSYKKFSFCEQSYFIENILNYRFPAGKAANLGTITHAVLETLAKIKLGIQDKQDVVETEVGEMSTKSVDINKLTDDLYKLYTAKPELKHLEWSNKDFKDIQKYVNKAVNHNNGYFNPLNRNIVSTEQYIKLEIKEPWAILPDQTYFKITGFIDLITHCNTDCLEITDYKSGNPNKDFLSGDEINEKFLFNDIQMRLYHYSCCEIYGYDKTYLITLFFLQSGPMTISFSPEDAMATKEKIKERFIKIYNTKIPRLSRSYKCSRFCDYGKNSTEKAPIQFLDGQVSPVGAKMCICDLVKFETDRRGIGWVAEHLKNDTK